MSRFGSDPQRKFGAVMDSGFYHLFNPEQCAELIEEVASVLIPGGCYYLHEFAVEFPMPNVPRQVSVAEVQSRFILDKGWRVLEVQSVEFLSRVAPPVPATCSCVERITTK
ncbi:hypothetical protein GC175_30235 [bacterium]|nr:hypothetical protein [bacterium]